MSMAPGQRQQMIESMVDGLAARLKTETGDAEGWARLIRSYVVLDRKDDARAAWAEARVALAGDEAKLAVVEEAAKAAGLTETAP
jgi:cytochrome c-type biogenesis protein CcmH